MVECNYADGALNGGAKKKPEIFSKKKGEGLML